MARAALGLSTVDLARKAEVGANTINRFEAGQDARISSLEKMRSALEAAGVIFVDENGAGPGVRLKKAESDPASKITSFLGAHRNNGYCDDCICEETGGTLAEVRKVTEPLRRSFGFLSGVDNCARCSERKLTTMAVTKIRCRDNHPRPMSSSARLHRFVAGRSGQSRRRAGGGGCGLRDGSAGARAGRSRGDPQRLGAGGRRVHQWRVNLACV